MEVVYDVNLRESRSKQEIFRKLAQRLGLHVGSLCGDIRRGTVPTACSFHDRDICDYSVRMAQNSTLGGNADNVGIKIANIPANLLRQLIAGEKRPP